MGKSCHFCSSVRSHYRSLLPSNLSRPDSWKNGSLGLEAHNFYLFSKITQPSSFAYKYHRLCIPVLTCSILAFAFLFFANKIFFSFIWSRMQEGIMHTRSLEQPHILVFFKNSWPHYPISIFRNFFFKICLSLVSEALFFFVGTVPFVK